MMMYQLLTTVSSNKVTAGGKWGAPQANVKGPLSVPEQVLAGTPATQPIPPPPKVCPLPEEPVGEPGLAEAGGGA